METKTHWKQLVDTRFIGAYALPNGEDITVTIDYVQRESVKMLGGKTEDCSVMHLRGSYKPMILNATNSKSIQKLYGPYIEDWAGKDITLYASTTKMAGEIVECLRIRPTVAAKRKPGINDARLRKAIDQINLGAYTLAKLRAGFALTEDQELMVAELLNPEHAGEIAHD